MSICGGCPYPYEYSMEGYEDSEAGCRHDCTFEDAVYKIQWAYRQLEKRYEELLTEYNKLKREDK